MYFEHISLIIVSISTVFTTSCELAERTAWFNGLRNADSYALLNAVLTSPPNGSWVKLWCHGAKEILHSQVVEGGAQYLACKRRINQRLNKIFRWNDSGNVHIPKRLTEEYSMIIEYWSQQSLRLHAGHNGIQPLTGAQHMQTIPNRDAMMMQSLGSINWSQVEGRANAKLNNFSQEIREHLSHRGWNQRR